MSKNPYDVLGVSQNASDDEIKKAYRDLTRKYHPDANVNNPLADLAEEKFKEVQEAYDTIMNERASGSSGSSGGYSYGNGSYGGNSYGNGSSGGSYGGSYGAQADPRLQAAANYINSRRYREALNTLDQVQERSALWYYLSGCANAGLGNNVLARDHAAQAVNMEPNNYQYRQLDEDSMCLRHEHYRYFAPNVQIQVETSLVFLVHTVLEAILQSYLQRSLQDSHFQTRHKNHNRSISVVIA